MIGLSVQLLAFFFFTLMLISFGFRVYECFNFLLSQAELLSSRKHFPKVWIASEDGRKDWRIVLYTAALTCTGFLVSTQAGIENFTNLVSRFDLYSVSLSSRKGNGLSLPIFNCTQFLYSYDGYIPTHEAFFYLLDSLPLLLAIRFTFICIMGMIGSDRIFNQLVHFCVATCLYPSGWIRSL